ncbi:MAG: hypothetical protein K6T31_02750, partial [Alicyclobacillus sp.]|nr:hypothetical protein [Alicyclobacillus sp.]
MSAVNHDRWTGYWRTLWQVVRRPAALADWLDLPLATGLARSRWTAAWSSACWEVAWGLHHLPPKQWLQGRFLHELMAPAWANTGMAAVLLLAALAAGMVAAYGLLRLYTLLSHVLATNVFRVRGQRLRLLNIECTALTLAAPAAAGWALTCLWPLLGWSLTAVSVLYGTYLWIRGYTLVFHLASWQRGLWLWLRTTLVTGFVLSLCSLAVAVAIA